MLTKNKIKRITVKRMHPPVVKFMLSFVLYDNSATFSLTECLTYIPIIGCNNVDLFLTKPNNYDFIRLESIISCILQENFFL